MSKKLAELLFPDVRLTKQEIFDKYPKRNINNNEIISRFAPSPTGYMHIGNFFQMFISYRLAKMSGGKFFLRIEDTDAKRFKDNAVEVIYNVLERFGIKADEYQNLEGKDIGNYGPYVQSQRKEIYQVFAKELVEQGKAFPCFCKKTESKEEVAQARECKYQDVVECEYDPCRELSFEQVKQKIEGGEKFAIRLKTKNTGKERVDFVDLIKGKIELQANAKDVVLLKNDGIPPYAFAHAIDDTLMGTTLVVRGEEWIGSTPAHLEIFEALGFEKIDYCHNPLICKIDENGKRRKISKRFDPEADMRFYFEQGYPINSILEYLLNIINSGFEIWRNNNPEKSFEEFVFGVNDITAVAPIFDLVKLADISKNIIAKMSAIEVFENVATWANEFDIPFAKFLEKNKEYSIKVFNIDRDCAKPRKDIFKWAMIKDYFDYMFLSPKSFEIDDAEKALAKEFVKEYLKEFKLENEKNIWFENVKSVASKIGYCVDNKEYKLNPENYKGNIAKACEFVRIALTGRKNSPDIFEIMTILKEDEVKQRLTEFLNII